MTNKNFVIMGWVLCVILTIIMVFTINSLRQNPIQQSNYNSIQIDYIERSVANEPGVYSSVDQPNQYVLASGLRTQEINEWLADNNKTVLDYVNIEILNGLQKVSDLPKWVYWKTPTDIASFNILLEAMYFLIFVVWIVAYCSASLFQRGHIMSWVITIALSALSVVQGGVYGGLTAFGFFLLAISMGRFHRKFFPPEQEDSLVKRSDEGYRPNQALPAI